MSSQRSETTKRAIKIIDLNMENGILGSAIIIASNYVQMRLGSLLADHYLKTSEGARWVAIAELIRNGQPYELIEKCAELDLIKTEEAGHLKTLFGLRNKAAHEVTLWRDEKRLRKQNPKLVKQARLACNASKSFLERTGLPD